MAQAFRAAGTAATGNTSGTTTAPGSPSGLAANDILVVVLTTALPGSSNTQPTVSTPSGWTLLASSSNQSTTAGDGMFIYGKVAAGGDTMPTWNFGGVTATKYTVVCYDWSGVPGNALPSATVVNTGNGTSTTGVTNTTGTNSSAAWAASVVSGRSSTNTTYTVSGGTNNTRRQPSGITANTVANAGGGGSTDQLLADSNGAVSGTVGGESWTAGTTSTWQLTALIQFASASTNATVTAVAATATAAANAPVPSIAVPAVAATATASAPAPTVSTSRTGVAATGTAGANASTVSTSRTAVVATATAGANAPVPSIGVPAVAATATAASAAPVVSTSRTAVAATATAAATAPTVSLGASIAAVVATATATALAPTDSGTAVVTGVVATATAAAPAPVVVLGQSVFAVAATVTAAALAPSVSGTGVVSAGVATADARTPYPTIPHIPLTARLNIDRVIINLADDLAQYVAAGSAGGIGGGGSRADTFTQAGEFRPYANGRTRLIQGVATSRVLDPLVLRACTPAQVAKLKAWTGEIVQVRDSYGRLLYGAYLQPIVSDIPLSGTAGVDLLSDVQLVITEVTR